jgi:putative porin
MMMDSLNKKIIFVFVFLLFSSPCSFSGSIADDEFLEDELIDIDESIENYEFFGDVQLRSDSVRDLPRPIENDFDRVTARARLGVLWSPVDSIEVGLAGKVNLSSQSNSKTRFNLDNERANDVVMDELFLNYHINEQTNLQIGQTHFPLRLSPMVWDQDLRPQGISIRHRKELNEFNSLDITGGIFLGNHLFGDNSNIKAMQAALNIGEGKNTSYKVILSYIDFNNLADLAANGLRRTNLAAANGNFAHDFDNLDMQINLNFNQHAFPIRVKLDLINNLAVGKDDFGARADLILGNSIRRKGIELGLAAQRIQREALVGAFNDDDWWFPTRMRGTTVWLAYGLNESIRMKAQVFTERRDDKANNNKRALFDLQYTF